MEGRSHPKGQPCQLAQQTIARLAEPRFEPDKKNLQEYLLKKVLVSGLALVALTFATLAGSALAAPATETVTPASLGDGWYPADTRPPGTGTFENGPATPPLGIGSFELSTPDNVAKVQLFTDRYDGVALADIDGIGYSTYRDAASTGFIAGVAALNMRVDLTGDGNPDVYMVYEPYQDQGNAAVQTGVWQTWDAYQGGGALWWINSGAGGCGQDTPCEWNDIVEAFPSATIQEGVNCGPGGVVAPCPGSLGVNQGSFNSGIISNVDALYVSVGGEKTTFDFELFKVAGTSDDCKNDGWEDNSRADGSSFKNQGDCIQYLNTGK